MLISLLGLRSNSGRSHLAFLVPVQKSSTPLPSSVLLEALLAPPATTASLDLLRWVSMLPIAGDSSTGEQREAPTLPHSALVSFWTATLVQFCLRWSGGATRELSSAASQGSGKNKRRGGQVHQDDAQLLLSVLLPAAVQAAGVQGSCTDLQTAAYMVLCSIGGAFHLSADAVRTVLASVLAGRSGSAQSKSLAAVQSYTSAQAIRLMLAACYSLCASVRVEQDPLATKAEPSQRLLTDRAVKTLVEIPRLELLIRETCKTYDIGPFLAQLLGGLVSRIWDEPSAALLSTLASCDEVPADLVRRTAHALLALPAPSPLNTTDGTPVAPGALTTGRLLHAHRLRLQVLSHLRQRHPSIFDKAVRDSTEREDLSEAEKKSTWRILRAVFSAETANKGVDADVQKGTGALWLGVNSADAGERNFALEALFCAIQDGALSISDDFTKDALLARVADDSPTVLKTLYSHAEVLLKAVSGDSLISAVIAALGHDIELQRPAIRAHLQFALSQLVPAHPKVATRVLRHALWPRLLWTKANRKTAEMTLEVILESGVTQEGAEPGTLGSVLRGAMQVLQDGEKNPGAANESIVDTIAGT